jgi:hypothetical protein
VPTTPDAASLVLTADGRTSTFELIPLAVLGDIGNNKLTSRDAELPGLLDSHHELTIKLRVTIDGIPFSGVLEHREHEH